MPLHTCTPSDSSFWTDVAEALVTPTGTSAFLLEDVNRYCDVTEAECFDGKLVLQASAVEMIEPKQMDEHTAERILGHLLCWDPRDVRVDHQERQKRDLSAGKAVRALAAAEARANTTVGTHCLDALVLNSRLTVADHRARAAPFERVVLL